MEQFRIVITIGTSVNHYHFLKSYLAQIASLWIGSITDFPKAGGVLLPLLVRSMWKIRDVDDSLQSRCKVTAAVSRR